LDPLVRRGQEQNELADRLGTVLARDGYHLEIVEFKSQYPIYRVNTITNPVAGRPKNLIFASTGPKPEIGFRDAVNNDVIILSNAKSCLVYDRPTSDDGVLWSELAAWWHSEHCDSGTTLDAARRSLGRRLRQSLCSDAERSLFDCFFRCFRPILGDSLPALIPQVYLHYDPAIVAKLRHRPGMLRQRMDFLMLLPHKARIIIEVDGQHHFTEEGNPSLVSYSKMVSADRDLRLLNYDVYRFGANELVGPAHQEIISEFFGKLFDKHHVGICVRVHQP
jgi:hypothetical protein